MMHNADSGYDRYATDWEPGRDEFQGFDQTLFRAFLYEESRHIFDTLAAFVAHGLFQRFPRPARGRRRERRRVGAAPARLLRPRAQEDAGSLRRAPE